MYIVCVHSSEEETMTFDELQNIVYFFKFQWWFCYTIPRM